MNIEKRKNTIINTIKLSSLQGGNVFHFANISFDDALKEDAVDIVVSGGKDGRIQIAAIKDGLLLQRDECHKVCTLNTTMILDL